MNSNHSPLLSNVSPLRTPTKATGDSLGRSSGRNAGDSFNALYHKETSSFDDGERDISSNTNDLSNSDEKGNKSTTGQQDTSKADSTQLMAQENERLLIVNESVSQGDLNEIPALAENDFTDKDQSFETELLHGISVALPSNSTQSKVGEKFPPSGNELPPNGDSPDQVALLAKQTAESDLEDVRARADSGVEIRSRSDVGERSNRLRQGRLVDLDATRSIPSANEYKLETVQSKALADSPSESLSVLASKLVADPTTTFTTGNNTPASLMPGVSQLDSTTAQKISLAADAAANADLNASARSNSFDRSTVLGEKIHWMHKANISTAELHLHPAELGSIEIKIVTEDQQAHVSFITSSANARDVIEESLPKLRELLADSGLALDQSDISQRESGNEPARKDQQALSESPHVESEIELEFTASPVSPRIGQVDHYV